VTAIVVDENYLGPWRRLFGTLNVAPVETGGVLFYRLRPASSPRLTGPRAALPSR
jgi:hypothetical protein